MAFIFLFFSLGLLNTRSEARRFFLKTLFSEIKKEKFYISFIQNFKWVDRFFMNIFCPDHVYLLTLEKCGKSL